MTGRGTGLKAPIVWTGGKRRWARRVWEAFGPEREAVYVEPCVGSGAILLFNETPCAREIICDTSGLLANMWRGIKYDPEQTAYWADFPTVHQELTAAHRWCIRWQRENAERVENDPDFYDPKAAGRYAWGLSNWIGSGFGFDGGGGESHSGGGKRPHVAHNMGGQGVQPQRREIKQATPLTGERLSPWFLALAKRLEAVVILNRDLESALTDTMLQRTSTSRHPPLRIVLDPPYRTGGRGKELYQSDKDGTSDSASDRAYRRALELGEDTRNGVVFFFALGTYQFPENWSIETQGFKGVKAPKRRESYQDAAAFSPGCGRNGEREQMAPFL